MADKIAQLQFFSLCSKVTQEIENHVGIKDKVLGEFIVNLGRESQNEKEFIKSLNELGADFSQQFSTNLYNMILKMLPKSMQTKANKEKKDREFDNSGKHNNLDRPLTFEEEEEREGRDPNILRKK